MVVVLVLVVLVVLEAGSDKTITAELKLAVFSNPPVFSHVAQLVVVLGT
jgi:hypothetical protein